MTDLEQNELEKTIPQPLSARQHSALLGAIASLPINTLETFRNLVKAGFTEVQAEDLVRILFISSHKRDERKKA